MKNTLYAGFCSALLSSCSTPQTTFLEYPAVVEGVKSTYIRDSNDNCYLKVPQSDGNELRIYDENCDQTADSVALSFQEHFLFNHDRKELNLGSRLFLDLQLGQAVDYLKNKYVKRDYNEIPF